MVLHFVVGSTNGFRKRTQLTVFLLTFLQGSVDAREKDCEKEADEKEEPAFHHDCWVSVKIKICTRRELLCLIYTHHVFVLATIMCMGGPHTVQLLHAVGRTSLATFTVLTQAALVKVTRFLNSDERSSFDMACGRIFYASRNAGESSVLATALLCSTYRADDDESS